MSKTLILVRHAHRFKSSGRSADNGLSPKGHKQALKIKKHFKKVFPLARPLLISSPKKRCVETILPLVNGDKSKVRLTGLLDEGGALELNSHAFMNWWTKEAPPLVVACSHGDVLPVLVEMLTGANTDLKKGAWAEVELDGGVSRLTWLIQEF